MQIVRREIISCEPLELKLFLARGFSAGELHELDVFLNSWLKEKIQSENQPIIFRRPNLWREDTNSNEVIELKCEWLPEAWLMPLAEQLTSAFPALSRMEIGTDFVPPSRDDSASLKIPKQLVTFENGAKSEVNAFEIARYPVSIEQFARFVRATGYLTLAERRGDEFSFKDHPAISIIPTEKRLRLPARFVGYPDAMAFCEWAGVRLPTEAEWFAAALSGQRNDTEKPLCGTASQVALSEVSEELTSTIEGDRVVLRSGTYLPAWRRTSPKDPGNRRLVPLGYYEGLQFRTCTEQEKKGKTR